MDGQLMKAAVTGDATVMKQLASDDPAVLLGTTPQGNTCLHVCAIYGHEQFCRDTVALNGSLLDSTNLDGETPLITAVTRGRANLASVLLSCCLENHLSETIKKQDKHGCNALHHAIRRRQRKLALELLEAEPALSQAVHKRSESPMFIAVMRRYTDVFDKLLEIPDSAHSGVFGFNVLHAAVKSGNSVVAKRVLEARSELVGQENENKHTPMHLAVNEGKVDVLTVLLEHDPSLGHLILADGAPLLCIAASQGHVGVARELLKHCPDAPYCNVEGSTCLHLAVSSGQDEFVEFVLGSQQLQHLINMTDNSGKTALHLAATNSKTNMVDAFLDHEGIDVTVLDNSGNHAKALTADILDDSSEASEDESIGELTTSSIGAPMDAQLLKAAVTGDATVMKQLASDNPAVLLGTTPRGNTCLHISAIYGHDEFCKDALALEGSLLGTANEDGETALLTAVTRGHVTLASILLRCCCRDQRQLRETIILKQDKHGCNALHHAISGGHRVLALELIDAEPALSKFVNKCSESPMFIAAMNNYEDVVEKLLEIPNSAHSGNYGFTALHTSVRSGHTALARRIIEKRPWLVRQENASNHNSIMHLAVKENKVDALKVLLEHDPSLGYFISKDGTPLLCSAASHGHVGVARELIKHCPDAPYCNAMGSTCLHLAVSSGQAAFVRFVLKSQQLQHLVNVPDYIGRTALHLASSATNIKQQAKQHMLTDLQFHFNLRHRRPLEMDRRLLKASASGHISAELMKHLAQDVPCILHGTTPQGNTCLHIASIHGHEEFCKRVMALSQSLSLLTAINEDGETPLLSAVISGHSSLASFLLRCCLHQKLSETILKQDKRGCNALHHAIRSGQRKLAMELIEAEPALSHAVNQYDESPMFVAVMRNHEDVFDKLLEIPDSAHTGPFAYNALHAAVRSGNSAVAKRIMETRPGLAREQDGSKNTPIQLAVQWNKIDVLRVLLEHDLSLGYVVSTFSEGVPLLLSAAYRGNVNVARELLERCPDAPVCDEKGKTCLHMAVPNEQMEFVEFVLGSPILHKLVNTRDSGGKTPLHIAVEKCNPKMVAALLLHRHTDVTVLDNIGYPASCMLPPNHAKTLSWNEVSMLLLKADPQDASPIHNIHKIIKDRVTELSRKDIKSLTQTYTGNTSLVAILIATITFAAAFTLPGGYSAEAGNEGLPIMARKIAFQAFLISDTLAMCSSLAVAFVCIIARWEDLEFLLHYRSFTKKLMWFAYMATTTAFATGLYTVLAPRLLWLAVMVCALTFLLPFLTKLLGEWPILKLRFRLGRTFKSEFINMV